MASGIYVRKPITEEHRKILSEAHKGRKHTEETRQKIGLGNKGKIMPEEAKSNISKAMMGNKYALGRKHTEEELRKMSETHKGEKNHSFGKRGSANGNWKGGRLRTSQGYVQIYKPEHTNSDKKGYVLEHRFIMEEFLGRYLLPYEIIHHINGTKDDNRIENLELLPEQGKHNTQIQKVYQENLRLIKELAELKLQLVTQSA